MLAQQEHAALGGRLPRGRPTHRLPAQKTVRGDACYVVASSDTLNDDMLRLGERQLLSLDQIKLCFPRCPHVDSRDFYPIEHLLLIRYVVVAQPSQYHLAPDQQRVVGAAAEAFSQNWEVAKDFDLLPEVFALEGGVTVQVYRRSRPTSLAVAVVRSTGWKPRSDGGRARKPIGSSSAARCRCATAAAHHLPRATWAGGGRPGHRHDVHRFDAVAGRTSRHTGIRGSERSGARVQLAALADDGTTRPLADATFRRPGPSMSSAFPFARHDGEHLLLSFSTLDGDAKRQVAASLLKIVLMISSGLFIR